METKNSQEGTGKQKIYLNKLNLISELIEKIYNILTIDKKYISELVSDFNDLKEEFEPKYLKYINIKRFAVPIIGRISSGKSTFLNFLLGLKDILQTDTKITTRFVCIIRYNEEAENPKAYNVKLEERKLTKPEMIEKSNYEPKFNFEKGDEIKGKSIQEIIKERNEKIGNTNNYSQINNEDFFMIIEYKIPIFNEENLIEFSEVFEFMDLPGLNQYEKNNFFKSNILPIITQNVKFTIFIFDYERLYDGDTLDTYKYILNLGYNIQNNFYILNKIDLSENKNEEEEINKFKKYINDIFQRIFKNNPKKNNCKIEKENVFIATNSLLLSLENEKYNNFESYLNYKLIEIKQNDDDDHEPDFVDYLKDQMKIDFDLKDLNKNKNILRENRSEIKIENFLSEFNENLDNENFRGKLNTDNYIFFENIFKENNAKGEKNSDTASFFFKNLRISFEKSLESFFDLEKYKESLDKVMNKLKITSNDFYKIIEKIKNENDYQNSMIKIHEIKPIIDKLIELEPENEFMKQIELGYNNLEEHIKKDRKIRIVFLGLYSSGKSTIINSLIGNDILPTSSKECTKRGIIIRYHNEDIPELYKTKFILKNDYYCFEDSKDLICKGNTTIKEKLNGIFKKDDEINFEDFFYVVKVKIRLLDYLKLENDLKKKIEFIDFPGLNTEKTKSNVELQKNFDNLMKFTDGFNFINKDDLIKENNNVKTMKDIINRIESRKFKLDLDSCLFILNISKNMKSFSKEPKKEFEEIFFNEINGKLGFWANVTKKIHFNNNRELNVVQFNARLYLQYMKFEKEISNFEDFFMSLKEKKEINELSDYLKDDYCGQFEKENFGQFEKENFGRKVVSREINENVRQLQKIFQIENNKDKVIYEQLEKCCNSYDNMKRNIQSHKKFKGSNAPELFKYIHNQIKLIKENLDNNFKHLYKTYMTNLIYTFELINFNLLGTKVYREKNINEKKDHIKKKYNYYKIIINQEFNILKKDSFNKIVNFISNIKTFKNPEEESNKIQIDITESLSKFYLSFEEKSNKFKEELDGIFNEIISTIDLKIDSDNSVFKKFMNIKHLISHIGIGFCEGFGGLLYMGLLGTNPFGLFFGLGILSIHSILALSTFLYDKVNLTDTLIMNINEFKGKLIVRFDGLESEIEESIKKIKETAEKQIEFFVDSQNAEFKKIKENKSKFDDLFDKFKKMYEVNK